VRGCRAARRQDEDAIMSRSQPAASDKKVANAKVEKAKRILKDLGKDVRGKKNSEKLVVDHLTLLFGHRMGKHLVPTKAPNQRLILRGNIPYTHQENEYSQRVEIQIPPNYPNGPPEFFVQVSEGFVLTSNPQAKSMQWGPKEWKSEKHDLLQLCKKISLKFETKPPAKKKQQQVTTPDSSLDSLCSTSSASASSSEAGGGGGQAQSLSDAPSVPVSSAVVSEEKPPDLPIACSCASGFGEPCFPCKVAQGVVARIRPYFESQNEVLASMHTRIVNPYPTLFVLVPANTKFFHQEYKLYFVCAHSYERCATPINIKVSRKWVSQVAPVLTVSLSVLNIATKVVTGLNGGFGDIATFITQHKIDAEKLKLNDVLEAMQKVNEALSSMKDKLDVSQENTMLADEIDEIVDRFPELPRTAIDGFAEYAEVQNGWTEEMTCVRRRKDEARPMWVLQKHAHLFVPVD